jgi:hypothetical protein
LGAPPIGHTATRLVSWGHEAFASRSSAVAAPDASKPSSARQVVTLVWQSVLFMHFS